MTTPPTKLRPLPIIRLFVSSTFSDQQHERNALQANVWPKLERYCQQRGFTFQAIDLRWGVPAEAGLHHRTMEVCFEELKRSQKTSPEPNFLILLGNRYGWRPLPEVISTEEYGDLLKHAHGEAERAILETWYRLDTNAIPAVHLLRSRKDSPDSKDYTQIKDAEGNLVKKEDGSPLDTDHWISVQRTLWEIVNRAFPATDLAGRFGDSVDTQAETVPSIVRFQTSATEQEIWEGALKVANAKEHVIACFRTIQESDVVPPPEQRKKFVDLQREGASDGDAQNVLDQLKKQLEGRLDPAKIIRTECQWATDKSGKPIGDVTTSHIKQLCRCVYKRLRRIILQQIEAYWGGCDLSATNATLAQVRGTKIELDLECAVHQRFAEERAPTGMFIGRETEIASIRKYFTEPTNKPLIVHGSSGSGKTALLSKVIHDVTPRNPDGTRATTGPLVLSRFIGTTPESSNLRSLLTSLCRELRQEFPLTKTEKTPDGRTETTTSPLPTELNELIEEFYSQLSKATVARPILLFLDALDQIDDSDAARTVYWIRCDLVPPRTECHARLVTTCLSPSIDASEDGLTEDSKPCEPYRELKLREMLNGEPLRTLNEEQAHELFKTWLEAAGRKLLTEPSEQHQLIQSALSAESGRSPLYLKVLSEEARCWRSFDKAPVLPKSLPNTLPQLLAAVLDRLDQLSEHGPLVRIALSCLVSARYGLSEGELLEILFQDKEFSGILADNNQKHGHELPPLSTRIPIALWTRLRSDLTPYLSERSAPGTTVIHFYHRQVEQAVRKRYLRTPDQQTSRHRQLANYFDGRWNLPDAHALMELPSLLLLLQDHNTLFKLLTDLPFPMRKTHVGYVSDLIRNYDTLRICLSGQSRNSLAPWYYFLRGNAPYLTEHSELFFQQAFNEPVDSPVSQAAQHYWTSRTSISFGQVPRLQEQGKPPDGRLKYWRKWLQQIVIRITRHSAQSRLSGLRQPADANILPSAFLEWFNRPNHWEPPACLMTLQGHTRYVTSVAISADGRTIVSGSGDKTIKVWDTESGACRQTLHGHADEVWSIAISADGRTIVSGSRDKALKVWDVESGVCSQTLPGHTNAVTNLTVSADGQTIVSGSKDKTLKVWDAGSGTCCHTLRGHSDSVTSVALSADGRTIVSGSKDNTIMVWDTASGTCRQTLQGHTWLVHSVTLSADGRTIVSGSYDDTLKIWDAASGACRHTLRGHTDAVTSVSFSADGRTIVSGSWDKTLKIWDSVSGACRQTLQGHSSPVFCVALFSDGRTIVSGSKDDTLKVWSAESGAYRHTFQGHTDTVSSVALSADGRTIVSSSLDNTLKVWDTVSGACRHTLIGHTIFVRSVAASADGRTIISGSYDKTLKVWDAKSGACRQTLQGHSGPIDCVAISADGRTIVSGSWDETLKVWDAESGACRHTLRGHSIFITNVAVSADGLTIVSCAADKTLKVWDTRSGACRATYPLESAEAQAAWCRVARPDELRRLSTEGGPLQFPLKLLSNTQLPDANAMESLIAPGNFVEAYGPLTGDTILAFTANGEAHWFRLRSRDRE